MRSHKSRITSTAALVLVAGLIMGSFPMPSGAQQYVPPNRGIPGRREGGGTRGCWLGETRLPTNPRLTALTPEDSYGQTTKAYPTFYFYVPQFYAEAANRAEFVLQDESGVELYKATFQMGNNAGIISLSLPENANLPPLEIGQDYYWSFALACEQASDPTDQSSDIYVEGWLQRVVPSAEVTEELETVSLSDRPAVYAAEGIWYDAVSILAELRRAEPGNQALRAKWTQLLQSVGLESIAEEPLVPCCQQENVEQTDTLR